MKMVGKIIVATVAGVVLFASGVLASGVLDQYKEDKKNEVQMHFSQMESNAISYIMTLVEEFRLEDQKRIDAEVEKHIGEVSEEVAKQMTDHMLATDYVEQTEAIKEEHDKTIEELKSYIDEVAGQYMENYK